MEGIDTVSTGGAMQKPPESKKPDDNWEHRSANMRCGTCMFYVPKKAAHLSGFGRCRRHAPTMGGFPAVFATDWCGDHKIDENKI